MRKSHAEDESLKPGQQAESAAADAPDFGELSSTVRKSIESAPEVLERELAELKSKVSAFVDTYQQVRAELDKVVIGLDKEKELVLANIFMGGHVLMEGKPGCAKTLLVSSLAKALSLDFKRIQFTPDLLPGDITGSLVQGSDRNFTFRQGPLFTNVVLADEINRTGPKTQAALLEAMQEGQVTCDGATYKLPEPFIVLATQNPLDDHGTYPLPDAQLDRFSVKINFPDPSKSDLRKILEGTTGEEEKVVTPVLEVATAAQEISDFRRLVRRVEIPEPIMDKVLQAVVSLNPGHPEAIKIENITKYVEFGPSARGAQALILLSKTFALLEGRTHVELPDLEKALEPALKHRVNLKPEGFAEAISTSSLIEEVLKHLKD